MPRGGKQRDLQTTSVTKDDVFDLLVEDNPDIFGSKRKQDYIDIVEDPSDSTRLLVTFTQTEKNV